MYETAVSLKNRLVTVLSRAGIDASVHFVRQSKSAGIPYVVITPQDSPISRDSTSNFDDDVFEIHSVAGSPDLALRMLDAIVEDLRELGPDEMPIRGGTLVGCEAAGLRSVSDVTDTEDIYAGVCSFSFKVQRRRKP